MLGPIETLDAKVNNTSGGLFFNQNGDRLAAEIDGTIEIFEWPSRRLLQTMQLKPGVFGFVLSPGGRFCIGWPRAGNVPRRVWDATNGQALVDLPVSRVYGATFSPDEHLLITGSDHEYQAWDTGSWRNTWKLTRPNVQQPGRVTINHSGTMGALTFAADTIRLFDPATGSEFATLEAPEKNIITGLSFSPDDSHLAATTASSVVHMWDLRLIRKELATQKLDWDGPSFSPATSNDKQQITVDILADTASGPSARTNP